MEEQRITDRILAAAFKVHSVLGPGLLESAYTECHAYEMIKDGLYVEREKRIPIIYKELTINTGFRLDLLVEMKVIVEAKVVEEFKDVHLAQLLTYLKWTNCKVGLLLNFNARSLRHGIKRVVL